MKKGCFCFAVALFFVVLFCSCSVTKQTDITGRAVVITTDTTYIHHTGNISFATKR